MQVWDFLTGKLKKDLQYQADEQFMLHETAVLALNFSRDSELLVSGSQDGKMKVSLCRIEVASKFSPLHAQCIKGVSAHDFRYLVKEGPALRASTPL